MSAQDRLQPALLDRLTDDTRAGGDGHDFRVMTKQQLRLAVLRDLSWLLNAVQPLTPEQARRYPETAKSVVNYGLPALSGALASTIDIPLLERNLRDAILRFEPRILSDTLRVRAIESDSVMDAHNVIEFEIAGFLWAQPVPLELLLRTEIDLEAGQIEVRDAISPVTARSLR